MTDNFSKISICSEISEDLSAFIDGELPKEQLAKIYEHLLECDNCRQVYEDMKKTQKAVKNYFERSTEKFEIPEKRLKHNIVDKLMFIEKQKKIIYIAASIGFLIIISYSSISLINFNSPEKDVLLKVKFTKNESAVTPLPSNPKEFIEKLKDKKDKITKKILP